MGVEDTEEGDMVAAATMEPAPVDMVAAEAAEVVGEVMGVIVVVVAEVADGVEDTVAVGVEEVEEEDMGVIHRIEVLGLCFFSRPIHPFFLFFTLFENRDFVHLSLVCQFRSLVDLIFCFRSPAQFPISLLFVP